MPTEFLILGDSHCGVLSHAARALGLEYAGGALLAGHRLNKPFFTVEDSRLAMNDPGADKLLKEFLRIGGLGDNLLEVNVPILATMGFGIGSSIVTPMAREKLAIAGVPGDQYISAACFEAGIAAVCSAPFAFYRTLAEAGKRIYVAYPPQRYKAETIPIARIAQKTIGRLMSRLGVTMVDVRKATTDDQGILLAKFEPAREGDKVHGNTQYGKIVLRKFLSMAGIRLPETAMSAAAE